MGGAAFGSAKAPEALAAAITASTFGFVVRRKLTIVSAIARVEMTNTTTIIFPVADGGVWLLVFVMLGLLYPLISVWANVVLLFSNVFD